MHNRLSAAVVARFEPPDHGGQVHGKRHMAEVIVITAQIKTSEEGSPRKSFGNYVELFQ